MLSLIQLFKPEVSEIKGRLEALIEQGYVKRDEKEKGLLIYIPWDGECC